MVKMKENCVENPKIALISLLDTKFGGLGPLFGLENGQKLGRKSQNVLL